MKKDIEQKVSEMLEEKVNQLGYELYDVEYLKEDREWYLRIYIDKEDGIVIDDCQLVSNEINPILDEKDPIKDQYYLEVSSPGLDRKLIKNEHFNKFMGEDVVVKVKEKFEGKRTLKGILNGISDETINVTINKENKEIPRKIVKECRLEVKF